MKYLILSCVWAAYFILHSAMISTTATDYLKRTMGGYYRFYRLFYVIVSIATLVPVVWYSSHVKDPVFFSWDGYYIILKLLILATGIFLFAAGSMHYNFLRFMGIRQILDGGKHDSANSTVKLRTKGILGVIRHPYYSGVILLFWASDLDNTMLVINVIVTVYVIIGTLLEEHKLLLEFGDAYRDYMKRVSMFVPWKWLKNRFAG